jgi:hypothetical protein
VLTNALAEKRGRLGPKAMGKMRYQLLATRPEGEVIDQKAMSVNVLHISDMVLCPVGLTDKERSGEAIGI